MTAPSTSSCVLPATAYRRVRWRNGAGWTREIHAEAGDIDIDAGDAADGVDWDWRLSIAEIAADAPFSTFAGVDRELVLLSGNGLRLRFDDGGLHELPPPHGRCRFAGERTLVGELVDGPTQDFNLMWRRDRVRAELWHRPLVGPMLVFVDPGSTWVVHLLAGQARFTGGAALPPLAIGDTALLRSDGTRTRHALEGGGEALLIRIGPAVDRQGMPVAVAGGTA